MSGSAVVITLLSDHPANRGIGQDAAQAASDQVQRATGFKTAVAGVEVFDVDPAIFPTAGEAQAIKATLTDKLDTLGEQVTEPAADPTPSPVTAPEAPVVEDPTVTEVVPAPTTEEVSTPDPAPAAISAADVTTTEPTASEPTLAEDVTTLETAHAAAEAAEAAEADAEATVEAGVLDNPAQP